MAAVKLAAKAAGVASTGTKRQILARLDKATSNQAPLEIVGRAIVLLSGPPPGLPPPSPFSPSAVLPASPPWSPARTPTAALATHAPSLPAAGGIAFGGIAFGGIAFGGIAAGSASTSSSGSSRGAAGGGRGAASEMSAQRHAHEVGPSLPALRAKSIFFKADSCP